MLPGCPVGGWHYFPAHCGVSGGCVPEYEPWSSQQKLRSSTALKGLLSRAIILPIRQVTFLHTSSCYLLLAEPNISVRDVWCSPLTSGALEGTALELVAGTLVLSGAYSPLSVHMITASETQGSEWGKLVVA